MADYQAPLRDMRFVLNEVFDAPALWASLPKVAENVDPDTADAILEEAGKITSGVLAPLNREGDEQGSKWNDGEVTAPEGFKEAYQTIVEGGWNGLGGNPDFGGMGMPKTLVAQFEEMMQGANMAFGLAPMLTAGACLALDAHGSQELKEKYLPNMYSGVWSGAMDLTEPHAGTDLALFAPSRAEQRWLLQRHRYQDFHYLGRARHGREHHSPGARQVAGCAQGAEGYFPVPGAKVHGERRRFRG